MTFERDHFKIDFFKEYIQNMGHTETLAKEKYNISKEALRLRFVKEAKTIKRWLKFGLKPKTNGKGHTFYLIEITEQEKELVLYMADKDMSSLRWIKPNLQDVNRTIEFIERINQAHNDLLVPVKNSYNIYLTDISKEDITRMENLLPLLYRIERENLYDNFSLKDAFSTKKLNDLIKPQTPITLKDLDYLERFIKRRSKILPDRRPIIPSDLIAAYYILDIRYLKPSERTYNLLTGKSIKLVRDLLLMSSYYFRNLKGAGEKTLKDLDETLAQIGLSTAQIFPEWAKD